MLLADEKEIPLSLISGTWVQRTFKEAACRRKPKKEKRRRNGRDKHQ